jgi:hypothetical protein
MHRLLAKVRPIKVELSRLRFACAHQALDETAWSRCQAILVILAQVRQSKKWGARALQNPRTLVVRLMAGSP